MFLFFFLFFFIIPFEGKMLHIPFSFPNVELWLQQASLQLRFFVHEKCNHLFGSRARFLLNSKPQECCVCLKKREHWTTFSLEVSFVSMSVLRIFCTETSYRTAWIWNIRKGVGQWGGGSVASTISLPHLFKGHYINTAITARSSSQ